MNRFVFWFIVAVAVGGICWQFPLFHIAPLDRAAREKAAAGFNPKEFAGKFWDERLLKSLDQAVKADVLLPAIQANSGLARKQFARSVGVSESYTYFLSGRGRVLAVNDDEISLSVTEGAARAEVILPVGLLFGNAVRDGTGLLNVNDYPNSQHFNGIAEELNRIVEARVLAGLREQAKVGKQVRFVGCAEVNDESTDLKPLRVVPIQAEVE
jgi:predicted lipoprotein